MREDDDDDDDDADSSKDNAMAGRVGGENGR